MNHLLTESHVSKLLWLGIALTFPLFSVKYLRLNIGIMHVPMTLFVTGFLVWSIFLYIMMHQGKVKKLGDYSTLGTLCFLFFLWHLISLLFSENAGQFGLKDVFKVGVGIGCLWFTLLAFPRDPIFLNRFGKVLVWSSTIFLLYFIHNSLSQQNPFLGADFHDVSVKGSRNQLGWYVAMVLPFAFSHLLFTNQKWMSLIPIATITAAIVYIASRGAWVGGLFSLLAIIYFIATVNKKWALKITAKILIIVGILLTIIISGLSNHIDMRQLGRRFLWITNPIAAENVKDTTMKLNTIEERGGRIQSGFRVFAQSPLVGSGPYTNPTHNDYTTVLGELGGVGAIFFLGILAFFGFQCLKKPTQSISNLSWISVAVRGCFFTLLVMSLTGDNYRTPHFWFFLGLILATLHIEKVATPSKERSP